MFPLIALTACSAHPAATNASAAQADGARTAASSTVIAAATGNPVLGRWTGGEDCLVDLQDIEFTPNLALFHSPDASKPSNPVSYADVSPAGATVTISEGTLHNTAVIHVRDATHLIVDPIAGSTDRSCTLTRR
ncbi:hypothetical protein [Sphingomonas sp.]|uniref:hypothetical protein n=1 Tax=Sphingomonas sp. TaxID=28214 RepID=UPI003CC5111E